MKEYKICFIKYHTYHVKAETEDEAIEIAEDIFCSDMCYPVADTTYDEVEVEEV